MSEMKTRLLTGVCRSRVHEGFHIERWWDTLIDIVLGKVDGGNRIFGRRI